jgi:DNA-binding transcriptional LysR family regulator
MKTRRIDLNLLHVFDAIMRERSLTKAAKSLDLTPSAVSHAVGRLRRALRDELFLRNGNDMKPTPRALELAVTVRGSLVALEAALTPAEFTPAESSRSFRIAAGDYGCLVMLPPLVERLARKAPQIDLYIVPINRIDIGEQLERGAVDIVFGWFDSLPSGVDRRVLLTESGVFVVRAGHPLTRERLTHGRIFDFPHVAVDLTGMEDTRSHGFLDDRGLVRRVWMTYSVSEARGVGDLSARVAITLPSFTSVVPVIRHSDMVATLPERLARQAVDAGGVVILERIEEPVTVAVEAVWPVRREHDAGLRWLLDEMAEVCTEIDGRPSN